MTGTLPALAQLKPNPNWAKLPLFNRKNWTRVRFGDVARQLKEQVDPVIDGVERYVEGGHMETDNVHIRRWGNVGDGYLGPAFIRGFRKGQVLYGSRRTYLKKVAVAEWDGVTANTTYVLEADESKLLQSLLPWLMLSENFTRHSVQESKGSTNPYINFPDIAKFEFDLPPLDQQHHITEILWAMDGVAEAQLATSKAAEVYLKAVAEATLDQMFAGPCEKFADLWSESPDSGCSAPPTAEDTGHYVLSLTALSGVGYVSGNLKPVKPTQAMLATRLSKGDFLISRSNTQELVGRVGIYNEDRADVSFPDTMMRIHVDETKILKPFLEVVLQSERGKKHMMRSAAGTSGSMKKINRQTLGQCLIPTPSLAKQQKLLADHADVFLAVRSAEASVSATCALKSVMANSIFS